MPSDRSIPFRNRQEAGQALAEALLPLASSHPLILALPRGGVPVAYEIAKALDAEMDLLFVRKIGTPGHEEYGLGAVVDGTHPQVTLDENYVREFRIPYETINGIVNRQLTEIERQRSLYVKNRQPLPIAGRVVIVGDDGIATGGTMRAALRALRRKHPARLVLAVPVAPPDRVATLMAECDQIVCLLQPQSLYAVGAYYQDFPQIEDAEVMRLIAEADNMHKERLARRAVRQSDTT